MIQQVSNLVQTVLCVGALFYEPLRRRFAMLVLLTLALVPGFLVRAVLHTQEHAARIKIVGHGSAHMPRYRHTQTHNKREGAHSAKRHARAAMP